MFRLQEYRQPAARTAELLPWGLMVDPGVVLTKSGQLLSTVRFRGPDLESTSPDVMVVMAAHLNNLVKRLPEGWALQTDLRRQEVSAYPGATFTSAVAELVDAERAERFRERGRHYENVSYYTLSYGTPLDRRRWWQGLLWEDFPEEEAQVLDYFRRTLADFCEGLRVVLPDQVLLRDGALLRYLRATATLRDEPVAVPSVPEYLDYLLGTEDFSPGILPRLGPQYEEETLCLFTVRLFPGESYPGILAGLDELDFPFRWAQRWLPLSRPAAVRECQRLERHWMSGRRSLLTMLRMFMFKGAAEDRENPNNLAKAADATAAEEAVAGNMVGLGYYTGTFVTWDRNPAEAKRKLALAQNVFTRVGATVHVEDLNAVEAWLGTLPGHLYANVRAPLLTSLNVSHFFPLHTVWAGPERNAHLGGPPLMLTSSASSTPFRLDLHQGDVADTFVVGVKGAGKTVLLNMLDLQWQRYPGAQVIIFEKDMGAKIETLAMGGKWYELGKVGGLTLQPFARADDHNERLWAMSFMDILLEQERLPVTPELREELGRALEALGAQPPHLRTMSSLATLVQDRAVRQVLGAYRHLFDASEDHLVAVPWQCFEMGSLMDYPRAVAPTLFLLFHRLEAWLTGAPTQIRLDEGWLYLDMPRFAERLRLWLKTLRKFNGHVVFATQDLDDAAKSSLTTTLIQECQTKIFLPNASALDPKILALYESFGLTTRQAEIIAMAVPKRHYYYTSPAGNRLFDMELGPVALALAAAGSKEDLELADKIAASHPAENFAPAWFRAKGLDWAADALFGTFSA